MQTYCQGFPSSIMAWPKFVRLCSYSLNNGERGILTASKPWLGICSFAHLLICSFRSNQMSDCERFAQIAQDKWATVSECLRSLRGYEQLWANRSGGSEEMSDREWITQVAQDKWATLSDSLRSLRGNEQMINLLKKIWQKNLKSCF